MAVLFVLRGKHLDGMEFSLLGIFSYLYKRRK